MKHLKLKASALYWGLTLLILVPGLLLLALAVVTTPFKLLSKDLVQLVLDMAEWRYDTVYWYVINTRQGFGLTLEIK
jgi:hypothetical protein